MNANTLCAKCGHEKQYHLTSNGRGERAILSVCDFALTIHKKYVERCPCKAFRPADHNTDDGAGAIKTPVIIESYTGGHDPSDIDRQWVRDANGKIIGVFNLRLANQVATALNDHARLIFEVEELKAKVREYEEMLDNVSRLELDSDEAIYRGMVGYEIEVDGESDNGAFRSLQSAYRFLTTKEAVE